MPEVKENRSPVKWPLLTCVFALLSIVLGISLVVVLNGQTKQKDMPVCGSPLNISWGHINLQESKNPSVFHDLTPMEIKGLMEYLYAQKKLNLVKEADMKVNTSYVYLTEVYLPEKRAVLDYLDNNGRKPEREAHVIIFRGDKQNPDIQEIIAGPLPNPTSHRHNPYRPQSIPFIYRPTTGPEIGGIIEMLTESVDVVLGEMFQELFGGRLMNCGTSCVVFRTITPVSPALSGTMKRKTWFWLSQFAEYYILHPLDFAVLVEMNGPIFTIEKIWFNSKLFEKLTDVLNFYKLNKHSIPKLEFPQDNDKLFSKLHQRGAASVDPPLRNPLQFSPDGKRYNINDRHVEYMFWKFDFRMSAMRGPQLYDIRFKDERIIYELSLQEIAVFYSGSKPMHALANYLDGVALIGVRAKRLVPGVDCPNDSTFIGSTFQMETDGPHSFTNAFCLFEYNSGMPLRRHHSYSFHYGRFYEGMETTVLILRTIAVITNYDYILDFLFYPNGALQVKVVSTGYVLGSFYTEKEEKYSFKLHKNLAANLHQHLFNYKIDLDIKGTSNRFANLDIKTENIANKFSENPNARLTQHIFQQNIKRTEVDAAYKYNFDTPKYLIVYNKEDQIRKGYENPKGYRIINNGISKQLLQEGSGNEPSVSWSRYQVAVTRLKESEQTSSSIYAMVDVKDPIVHFQSFLDDNESIIDKDLVAWLTMGMHHIPHTEDLPVTTTPGMDVSFYLTPFNYFAEDPAISSLNAVRIEPKEKANVKTSVYINRYGVQHNLQCLPHDSIYDEQITNNPDIVVDTNLSPFI